MAYSFNDAKAAERHETQYFEMFGNRGIYHKGWTAVTRHRPVVAHRRENPAFDETIGNSTTRAKTGAGEQSAKQMPEKLHEPQPLG